MIQWNTTTSLVLFVTIFCSVLLKGVSPNWSTNSNRKSARLFDVKERDGFTMISDNLLDVTGQVDLPGKQVKSEEPKPVVTTPAPEPKPASPQPEKPSITNSTLSPLIDKVAVDSNRGPKNKVHMVKIHGNDTLQYYYMNLMVGNPPQQQSVIIDTGSETTAFPCSRPR